MSKMRTVRLSELKAGDIVVADADFPCMAAGRKTVEADEGGLFVPCSAGRHYLDGQIHCESHGGEDDTLIGLFLPPSEEPAA